jgi:hypothetical protein
MKHMKLNVNKRSIIVRSLAIWLVLFLFVFSGMHSAHAHGAVASTKEHARYQCCGTIYDPITNFQGFDACDAPSMSPAQLQVWWNDTYYAWIGFYLGGINDLGCANATASWISGVRSEQWSLLPLFDGLASPCQTNGSANMSINPSTAQAQGVNDAQSAMSIVSSLGLTDAVIYEDMEPYNAANGYSISQCNNAVNAYVTGWSQTLDNASYIPGLYVEYWNTSSVASASVVPADVDISNGGCTNYGQTNNCTVWNISDVSNSLWSEDQRVYQYSFNVPECYGGVCHTVDSDAANGQVWGTGQGALDGTQDDNDSMSNDP